jgi:lysophospholipase L1-like esterase
MGLLVLIVLALYGSVAGLVDSAVSPQPKPAPEVVAPRTESEAPPAATGGTSSGHLLVVGDSLAEGTEAPLAQLLPGWRIKTSAFTGRSTADGVAQILQMPSLPGTIAISLGTNDNPSATETFAGEVTQVLDAAGPSKCVVWANIARPPYGGVSYSGFNQILERLSLTHPNLLVVDWAHISHSQTGLLGSDGVHATSRGYALRAQAMAAAITSCGGVGTYGAGGAGAIGD